MGHRKSHVQRVEKEKIKVKGFKIKAMGAIHQFGLLNIVINRQATGRPLKSEEQLTVL